ncbi:hypothetical protein Y032_0097g3011 [Ancylostoma ceylanicum]|uniref:Uncharacterized protein n=1 Tax=Ancylostoma ceylanicum TaxID=53326 RepID=A0A016TJY7_9BILA|nr:hypothetical protein Y032_0097g3011 [Ancylostoma ceylanicum]
MVCKNLWRTLYSINYPISASNNFTVRACGDWGSRCEASATVCAEQGGVGQCVTCEDDLCNTVASVVSIAIFVFTAIVML